MRKSLLYVGLAGLFTAVLFASCGPSPTTNTQVATPDSVATAAVTQDPATYEGTLPAADGPGIQFSLALDPVAKSFVASSTYLESDMAPEVAQGTYEYDAADPTLLVCKVGDSTLYLFRVEGTNLRMLRADTTAVEGDMAEDYVLRLAPNAQVAPTPATTPTEPVQTEPEFPIEPDDAE